MSVAMQLFHASYLEIKNPKITNRFATLDFGVGFYTTSNKEQAETFALKVCSRRKKEGFPTVNIYEFNDKALDLNTLVFDSPSEKWLDFVVRNRKFGRKENYDLIIGPVANDDVFSVIALYESGQLTKEDAIKRFKVKSLYNQYLFCNEKALSNLAFAESYKLELE
ncbi:MAG: DUF3990 domain-containing protein [Candidatus Fibromonas sp.]|jgi:hypothetical protein|nr:DUF3990 domain-containing protein [Candidatus Fibromonas sp.]